MNYFFEIIGDWFLSIFTVNWVKIINGSIAVWNTCIDVVLLLLGTSPDQAGGGQAWTWVTSITSSYFFVTISSLLITVWFLYGLSKSSLDFGRNFDLSKYLQLLLPVFVINEIILNYTSFMRLLFGASVDLVMAANRPLSGFTPYISQIPADIEDAMDTVVSANMASVVFFDIIVFVCWGAIIFSAFNLILTAYNRILRLLAMIPLGILALPAVAAGPALAGHNPATGYLRTLIATLLEALIIMIVIYITASLLSGSHILSSMVLEDAFLGQAVYYILDIVLVATGTTAIAKGSDTLVTRIIG